MSIYNHFRDSERASVDYFNDLKRQVIDNHYPKLSHFLTPREVIIAKSILGQQKDILFAYHGGYPQAERTRLFIYPSYHQCSDDDFELSLFEVNYAKKFNVLHHRQVLGALLSLGIKREMIGDILINDEHVQFITTSKMAPYLEQYCRKIGSVNVNLEALPLSQVIVPITTWEVQSLTVSALRLDAVLASVLKLSRSKVQQLIAKEKVKLNHMICSDISQLVVEGDLLSIQGFGRCKLNLISSRTRKDKIRIEVVKLITK